MSQIVQLSTTLEPCAPGARKFPKVSCANRIVNARIPKVWFGVQEFNTKASGGRQYLDKMKVEVQTFNCDLQNPIRETNKELNDWVEEKKEDAGKKHSST